MLILVAILDIRSREVPDKVWLPFGALGIILIAYDFLIGTPGFDPTLIVLSVVITGIIGFGAYYLGFYGGADAKALLTLALLMPLYPNTTFIHELTGLDTLSRSSAIHEFTALSTLSNSLLLTIAVPIFMFIMNVRSIIRGRMIFSGFESQSLASKILVMFLGYRVKSPDGFLFKLEKDYDGVRKFDFTVNRLDDEYARGEDVWVTPGLPLLVFIALGFISLLMFGDILFILVEMFITSF